VDQRNTGEFQAGRKRERARERGEKREREAMLEIGGLFYCSIFECFLSMPQRKDLSKVLQGAMNKENMERAWLVMYKAKSELELAERNSCRIPVGERCRGTRLFFIIFLEHPAHVITRVLRSEIDVYFERAKSCFALTHRNV